MSIALASTVRPVLMLALLAASLAAGLLGGPRPAEAKFFPEYVVLLFGDRPVELSQDQISAWLENSMQLDGALTHPRPPGAFDAIAFWDDSPLTQDQRFAFALSGAGRASAGWLMPGDRGGTLLLRGEFGAGAPSASEQVWRSSKPLPVPVPPLASDPKPTSDGSHAPASPSDFSSDGGSVGPILPIALSLAAGAVLAVTALWLRHRLRDRRPRNTLA